MGTLQCYAIFSAAQIIWYLSQERGNPDRKQATVPVKIYSNAYVRLGNFNPPTFCLVYSIVARTWIHKCPIGRPRHVYNSIWANWKKEPTLMKTTLSLSTCHATATRANSYLGENYISDIILLHVFESFEKKLFQRAALATELWKYLVSLWPAFFFVLVNVELLCGVVATSYGMLLSGCMVGLKCLEMVREWAGKGIWISESKKLLLVQSGNQKEFACGIRNTAQGIRNLTNEMKSGIQIPLTNLESTTWNPESTATNIDCLRFPHIIQTEKSNHFFFFCLYIGFCWFTSCPPVLRDIKACIATRRKEN